MISDLIECPCCGSNACSKTTTGDNDVYLCWTCGMTTTSELVDGSKFEEENYTNTAELIKSSSFLILGISI